MIDYSMYNVEPERARSVRRQLAAEAALREAWAQLEALEDSITVLEAQEQERTRKVKGGFAAFAVSALGVAIFIGLCLVWGKR